MRRALLVLGGLFAAAVLLLLVVLIVVPLFFGERVKARFLAELNAAVDADVALRDADVSFLRAFPDVSVRVEDLVVTGRAPFAGVELARVGTFTVALDAMSLLGGGPVRVTGLSLSDAAFDLRTDAEGRTNTDLAGGAAAPDATAEPAGAAAPDATAEPTPELWLRDVALENVALRYEDVGAERLVVVEDLDLTGDAEVSDALVALRAKGTIAALSVTNGGVALAKAVKVATELDVRYAPETGAVQLGDSRVALNDFALALAGTVEPVAAGTNLDLTFGAPSTSFKGLLSLIPGAYTPDFGGVEADGALAFSGAVKGLLPAAGDDLPAIDLGLKVTDGRFRYPSLPTAVDGIQLDVAVKHPGGGPDAMVVNVPRFRLAVDGSPLEGSLALRTPVSDPAIETRVKGRLDLGKLARAFPEAVSEWTGIMDVDVDLAGKASAFSAGDVDAVRAAGTFTLTDAVWTDPEQPLPIHVRELRLAVEPRRLDLASFQLSFGDSDLSAKGAVENAIGWALADEVLVGRLEARSKKLDLNPWAGGSDTTAAAEPAPARPTASDDSSLFVVPKNLDLALDVAFGRVLYDDWDLREVKGGAKVKDGAVRLDDLRARTLGGQVAVSGTYAAPTEEAADVNVRVAAMDLGAAETIARLDTVQRILPGLREVRGKLRSGFDVKARLGKDLSPDLATLASAGTLGGIGLALTAPFLEPVATYLGDPRFGGLALQDGDVRFQVDAGKLQIGRVPVALGPAKGVLRGGTGILDETLDLKLELAVPADAVKAGGALSALGGKNVDTLDVVAGIGGTWKKPKVDLALGDSLKEAATAIVADVVDDLVAKASAQGDALIAEAEKAAQKIRDEAGKAADRLREEADAQAKKLVKDAKGNPLKEVAAKEAAKGIRAEADKAAKKLEKEADKKADAAVAAAKKEKEKLVTAAQAKAGK